MIKSLTFSCLLIFFYGLSIPKSIGQLKSEPFEFQFEDKTLRGLIEKPSNQESSTIVMIIPGYGRTDFVEGMWFSKLRQNLVAAGLTVCVWDKMGCGQSDGEFNALQPVKNSAEEALAAIEEIKKLEISGHEKIGLWGMSRAGWICPLIIEQFPIDFWISVSGTDDKENFGYLIKSNLMIKGKGEEEVEKLYQAWMQGHKIQCTGGSYEDCLDAIRPLMQDSVCRQLFGYVNVEEVTEEGRNSYLQEGKLYTSKGHFDEESGLWVVIEGFGQLLNKINCPVLALFGENDSQVDWRKTKSLYEETIGENPNSELTIKVFENCNHNLQKCITCAYGEDLSSLQWQACDNYYETMKMWLKEQEIID